MGTSTDADGLTKSANKHEQHFQSPLKTAQIVTFANEMGTQ